MTSLEAERLDADLVESWEAILGWLRGLDDDVLDVATPLPGMSVGDLVAHLGMAMRVLTTAREVTPADADLPRLGFAAYLASYAEDADGILGRTLELAAGSEDVLTLAETLGTEAIANLRELRHRGVEQVVVKRGVVDLTTLVLTRMVELVVHGDDLARSVQVPSPVDPTARTTVAAALLEVLCRRSGYDLRHGDERTWIRLATGRLGWNERADSLQPRDLAEGLPDLRAYLPVL